MSGADRTEPTREQLVALWAWQSAMGKQWRSKLLAAWERAGEGYAAYSPPLQQLRNTLGPEWLVTFKLPPNTVAEPSRLAPLCAPPVDLRSPAISGAAFRNRATPEFIVTLTEEQAQALEWVARHLAFSDAFDTTPPHLGKEIRTERAYGIVHAAAALEEQLRAAGVRGDSWMYAS